MSPLDINLHCLINDDLYADIKQILSEAQHRWLRPAEICEILRNYQKFFITPEPPHKPVSTFLPSALNKQLA